ncbi:MAG: Rne/Rng family ribonuclease [Muribaculaceae bacterium]|nr:Rne/Rng family ribonuclease [Muribaculaceae bacterium]
MKSELIVDVQQKDISIALLEDSRLVSLQKESRNIAYAVGDLYLAKVKKIMPGLNAAFVDVGYEKDAFLHYLDLGAQFSTYQAFVKEALEDKKRLPNISKFKTLPDIPKTGTIQDLLQPGQELMVQIAKEPISSKGPRLTTELSFTGRFMVLIPFGDKISISQKIKSAEEKIRLRQLISSIKPKGFGVIVRTSAENKRVAELNHEMRTLVKSWEEAIGKMQRSQPPALIYEEDSRAVSVIRDIFSPTFESIWVNDPETFTQIQNYVTLIAPETKDIVKLYNKEIPIFDHFNVTRQIKSSFGKTVSFKSGAYIIIEHTEALHVIDVNSGNRSKASPDQESNALDVNLKAADEIARQLRLRDMGGIIVIDFIDMAKPEHRQTLFDHMREVMANDRARHNILPLSKFGLMQITRQRVRPALDITTAETCPSCYGRGEVQPSLLFTDKLDEKLDYLVNHLQIKKFVMYVHPYVEAYIKKGLFSLYGTWRRRYGRNFKIVADESLAYLQYRVIDAEQKEVDLKEERDLNSNQTKTHSRMKNHDKDNDD